MPVPGRPLTLQDLFAQLANNASESIPLDSTEVLNQFYADSEGLNLNVSGSPPTFTTSTNYSTNVAGEYPTSYWRLAESSGGVAFDSNQNIFSIYPRISSASQTSITQNATSFLAHSHSAQFTATTSAIVFNNAATLQITTDLSIEFWVNFSSFGTNGSTSGLLSKDNASLSSGEYSVYLFNNAGVGQIAFGFSTLAAFGGGSMALNTWYYVAVTRNDATKTATVYINGSQVAQQTYVSAPVTTTNNVVLGNHTGVAAAVTMLMTEVAIYHKPLTSTQVSTHYNWGIAADALAEAYNGGATLYGNTPYPAYGGATVATYNGTSTVWGTFQWK